MKKLSADIYNFISDFLYFHELKFFQYDFFAFWIIIFSSSLKYERYFSEILQIISKCLWDGSLRTDFPNQVLSAAQQMTSSSRIEQNFVVRSSISFFSDCNSSGDLLTSFCTWVKRALYDFIITFLRKKYWIYLFISRIIIQYYILIRFLLNIVSDNNYINRRAWSCY